MRTLEDFKNSKETILKGGKEKYHQKNKAQKKFFARERISKLLDPDSFVEDALWANSMAEGLPADGVVTGFGKLAGRTVAVIANDSTVKAGSWGWRTVEKMIRLQEQVAKLKCPLFYLIDSAGARITDQVEMFPGRRGAGKIFHMQCRLSGVVPQVCLLFGPSAAGGAYIPAFCDLVIMVKGNASMYLGSPRMAEMAIGEKVSLEKMGGAEMHCRTSGVGDLLVDDESQAIEKAKQYISYFPQNYNSEAFVSKSKKAQNALATKDIFPENPYHPYDVKKIIDGIVDAESFFEIKELFAKEMVVGLARLDGKTVGVLANQPKEKGGVIFVDSADKAARFVNLCNAFNIPLLFLADVPGFMIGSRVESQGIIRHGAKMVYSICEATVAKICVVMRKAYGAGLYAMNGPGFDPDCTLALPTAKIAVMGPEPAVNAVYFNKIKEMTAEEAKAFVKEKKEAYEKDLNIQKLGSELIIDGIIEDKDLRLELIKRFDLYKNKDLKYLDKKSGVRPV